MLDKATKPSAIAKGRLLTIEFVEKPGEAVAGAKKLDAVARVRAAAEKDGARPSGE